MKPHRANLLHPLQRVVTIDLLLPRPPHPLSAIPPPFQTAVAPLLLRRALAQLAPLLLLPLMPIALYLSPTVRPVSRPLLVQSLALSLNLLPMAPPRPPSLSLHLPMVTLTLNPMDMPTATPPTPTEATTMLTTKVAPRPLPSLLLPMVMRSPLNPSPSLADTLLPLDPHLRPQSHLHLPLPPLLLCSPLLALRTSLLPPRPLTRSLRKVRRVDSSVRNPFWTIKSLQK